jgi:SanA protein
MRKFLTFILVSAFLLMLPWMIISWQTYARVYRDVDTIPVREVGLLLGTTPSVGGQENLFFSTRIEAAKELYERGKILHILVSWDNSTPGYNEPQYMKNALLSRGIPESAITLDYAGYRTLDSMVRAKEVFSLSGGFTVISQPFHIERALYLGDMRGISAIGYGAANVSLRYGPMAYLREIPARWLALYDAWFGTEPAVLWEKVKIGS